MGKEAKRLPSPIVQACLLSRTVGDKVVRWADKPQSQILLFFFLTVGQDAYMWGARGLHSQWDTTTRDARIPLWDTKTGGILWGDVPSLIHPHIPKKELF